MEAICFFVIYCSFFFVCRFVGYAAGCMLCVARYLV